MNNSKEIPLRLATDLLREPDEQIENRFPKVDGHEDLALFYAMQPDQVPWAVAILDRLKEEYHAGRCHCICECYDTTIVREGAEVWQNYYSIEVADNDGGILGMNKFVVFYADHCPICGRPLPTPDGGSKSNGLKEI